MKWKKNVCLCWYVKKGYLLMHLHTLQFILNRTNNTLVHVSFLQKYEAMSGVKYGLHYCQSPICSLNGELCSCGALIILLRINMLTSSLISCSFKMPTAMTCLLYEPLLLTWAHQNLYLSLIFVQRSPLFLLKMLRTFAWVLIIILVLQHSYSVFA